MRKIFSVVWFSILFSWIFGVTVYSKTKIESKDTLNVSFTIDLFSDVDFRDAQVALELWGTEMSKHLNADLRLKTSVFTDLNILVDEVNKKKTDMVVLSPIDYLKIKDKTNIIPAFFGTNGDKLFTEIVILANKDCRINKISDLKNKHFIIHIGRVTKQLKRLWLNVLLKSNNLDFRNYFQSIKEVRKISQAILPVFFQQSDACMVDYHSFQLMSELNPQLSNKLFVIKKSPAFLKDLTCFREDLDPGMKDLLRRATENLMSIPQGEQILTFFKANKVVPFKPEFLESTIELVNSFNNLSATRGKNSK